MYEGLTLMTKCFPKAPPPSTITLGVSGSAYRSWGGNTFSPLPGATVKVKLMEPCFPKYGPGMICPGVSLDAG